MTRKRKAPEPPPRCLFCGCPELGTFGRQTSAGFIVYTSCNACGKLVADKPIAPHDPVPSPPTARDLLARVLVAADGARDPVDGCRCMPKELLDDIVAHLTGPLTEERRGGS